MRFAIPSILWLLLIIPVIGFFLFWAGEHRRALMGRFGSGKSMSRFGPAASRVMTWVRMGLFLLGMTSLIVALARPQWGFHERQVITRGVDMVVAIDTSASMMARDFPPSRLSRAKDLLKNLIWEARGDRVGIVAFAGSAVVLCPLTLDYKMASTALKAVDVNTVSTRGTNIGAAIKAANGAFELSGSNDRVLVLLTDGEQLEQTDELQAAVKKAKESGVRIFSIGLGTGDGSSIPTLTGPLRDESGSVVKTKLDFDTLKQISTETDGEAIRAEKIGAGEIADISAALSKFRGHKQQDKTFRVYHDRYPWFVGAALLFFALEALLHGVNNFKWRSRKKRAITGVTSVLAVGLILTSGQATAYPGEDFVHSRDALQKYHAGEYDQSTALYEEAAKVAPQKPEIMFNLGAAAAKAGKVDEARESLGKVYDPENASLNANARFGVATLNHREIRKQIAGQKEKWAQGLAKGDEASSKEVNEAIDKLKKIIDEYKQTILAKPDDIDMKANYELARKDLEELEKLLKDNQNEQQQQQQQQQKQDNQQQKQDQQKSGEDQKQGEQNQNQKGEQGKDKKQGEEGKQNQDQQENKPQDKPGEDKQNQQKPEGNDKDNKQGEGQQEPSDSDDSGDKEGKKPEQDPNGKPTPTPAPSPTPSASPQPGQEKGAGQSPAEQGQPVPIGQMSPTDVDRLLNTLPPEDQQALQLMMGTPSQQPDMKHEW